MTMDIEEGTKKIQLGEQPITLTLKKFELVVQNGPSKDQKFLLDKTLITIGAKSDNDLVLNDGTVSRKHCEILSTKDGYVLRDLESTNGTFLGNVRVKEVFLTPGSMFKVGNTQIEFVPRDEKINIFPSKKAKFGKMVGASLEMRKIFGIVEKIAPTDITVLIEGETGTGKELVAEAIHDYSLRNKKPFIIIDCSAVAENLIESELFGHEKGAFTNAISQRKGAFENADGGTIFLDEIGELTLELQPKLLRALESRTFKRVGGDRHLPCDVRVVAATNRNLEREVKEGRFREDLYYRLAVVPLYLPPLKKRRDDIPLIIQHFINTYNTRIAEGKRIVGVDDKAMEALKRYPWPGNIRELKNVVDRAITFCQGDMIKFADLPEALVARGGMQPLEPQISDDDEHTYPDTTDRQAKLSQAGGAPSPQMPEDAGDLDELPFHEAKDKLVELWERDYIVKLLQKNDNNISKAAKSAGIDRKSIQRILKKYNLTAKDM